ncbi:MAG: MFS transporter [Synechococcales bacterium]|nr:MFS transporter [Synechococcales bacterium]
MPIDTPTEPKDILQEAQSDIRTPNQWLSISGIALGVFIFALDVYIVNLAIPSMVVSLNTSFAAIQWVILSYLLAIAIFVLTISKLGDVWNKKSLYIIGLIIFTLSSLLCGLSPGIGWLIAFRFLQGIGAASLSGLGTAIIVAIFPPQQRGLGLGVRAAVYGLGISLGPAVGGLLLQMGGWPLIFLVNVPIGILSCWLVAQFVPPLPAIRTSHQVDSLGIVLLTITLACFSLGITLYQSGGLETLALILLIVSALSLVGFLRVEVYQIEPILDFRLFRSLDFSLGLVLRFVGNFVMAGVIFILPFFLELGQNYPVGQAGLVITLSSLVIVLAAPVAGALSDRFGSRFISFLGLGLMVLACWTISLMPLVSTLPGLILSMGIYGLGVGMFTSPNNSTIMGATPKDQVGVASGLLSLSRILGQMVGLPLVSLLFSMTVFAQVVDPVVADVTHAPPEALIWATQITFRAMAILLVVLIFLAVICLGTRRLRTDD